MSLTMLNLLLNSTSKSMADTTENHRALKTEMLDIYNLNMQTFALTSSC